MQEVLSTFFFSTIENAGIVLYQELVNEISIIHAKCLNGNIIHIQNNYEYLDPHDVANWLSQLGLLHILHILVPDHPVAEESKKLQPPI